MWKRWIFRILFVPIAIWMVVMGMIFRMAQGIATLADYLGGTLPDKFEAWCLDQELPELDIDQLDEDEDDF